MVVDAVDQLAAEESAQPAEQAVNEACRADRTAVWTKKCVLVCFSEGEGGREGASYVRIDTIYTKYVHI